MIRLRKTGLIPCVCIIVMIAHLVVSSVPDMSLRNITVVDQRGNLLSDFEQQDPRYAEANRQLDYNRQIENDLLQRINSLL